MPKYRKKPVVIEAVRYQPNLNCQEVHNFCGYVHDASNCDEDAEFMIETPEGTMIARPDDYIIRGVKGELYPCKPDIFEATYDLVDESVA